MYRRQIIIGYDLLCSLLIGSKMNFEVFISHVVAIVSCRAFGGVVSLGFGDTLRVL